MPSAPTPDTVAAFHTRLIESLLAQLRSIARVKSTAALSPLIDAFKDVDTWSSLQTLLRAKLGAPGTKLLQGDADTLRQSGQAILFVLERIGAKKLVEACLAIDEQTVDAPASSSISRADHSWQGLCELMAWLSAVRSALLGEVTPSAQPTAAISSTAVETSPAESAAPVSPPVIKPEPVSASVGFAPPPRAGALAKEQDEKRARLSAANPPVAAAASVPTEANSRMATSTSPPVASSASATSTAPAGSKAAAFAMRMSAMSGSAVASTSAALPSGPPSAGFAPPPGPGASAFDKKPKASAPRKPRASAPPAAVVEAAQAQMDEAPRAKRERKSSVKVRETSAGDERDEATRFKAGSNGKKRFTSYDDPSDSDGVADDAELDELASDYEEQLERKRRRLEGLQSDGSMSRRASGGGNRKPRDPAAERERQLAIIAKEEAELAKDPKRFKVGEAVIARFPNYSYWPAVVLDGTTAPPKTQGKREKGSYLVKSIPTGGDHRWVPPDDSSILAVTTTQLDDIILGRYKSAPPPSWKKWRGELVDAAMMIKDEERLKEWFSHPTPTEVWQMAQAERKKAARASAAW